MGRGFESSLWLKIYEVILWQRSEPTPQECFQVSNRCAQETTGRYLARVRIRKPERCFCFAKQRQKPRGRVVKFFRHGKIFLTESSLWLKIYEVILWQRSREARKRMLVASSSVLIPKLNGSICPPVGGQIEPFNKNRVLARTLFLFYY